MSSLPHHYKARTAAGPDGGPPSLLQGAPGRVLVDRPARPKRAIPLTPRSCRPRTAVLAVLLLGVGCAKTEAGAVRDEPGADSSPALVEQELGDLVTALRPPPVDAHSGIHDDWLRRRRTTLDRMKNADPAFGEHILAEFAERSDAPLHLRTGLLEAATRANPVAAREVLAELVSQYGEDLGVRTEACRLLGESSPERAIEVIEPILMDPERASTSPPDEAMLDGWLRAHEALDRVPMPGLAMIATDIRRDQATRHRAVRALADYPGGITVPALQEILVESTGNAYLRRLATQSLIEVVEPGELCGMLEDVFLREADGEFKAFLANVIEDHCRE